MNMPLKTKIGCCLAFSYMSGLIIFATYVIPEIIDPIVEDYTVSKHALLIGTWEQPNVNLDIKANGHYNYLYNEDGYSNKQSGKYFADKDSVVLYGFYPQAYTPESKNERWTIRKLTPDSLTVYVHKSTVVQNGDTLNTVGNEIETYKRKKSTN